MASIRARDGRWQARVKRRGYPEETATFPTRTEAERWARSVEAEMDRGAYISPVEAQRTSLGDLIERYIEEVLPTLRGGDTDRIRLKAMGKRPIAKTSMAALSPARLAEHRDERLRNVAPGTVIREFAYLSAIINHARKEWGIHISNPVALVRMPPTPKGRNRVLNADEEDRLLRELAPVGRRSPWMQPLVKLALETAMRRGELLALRWEHVNLRERTATLLTSKNGEGRVVPLSTKATETLSALPRSITGVVFPIQHAAVSKAFEKALVRAGLDDVRFHDLRHTATTRIATKLPNVIELAAITGHKSLKMLQRYYHPRAEDLARKLG